MPTLNDLVRTRCDLAAADVDWLHLLIGDWQLLSDLSFADLVLWLPTRDGEGFVAAAQCRPSTGPTVHYHDIVGSVLPRGRRPQVDAAFDERRIGRERDPEWRADVPVREETAPVVRAHTPIGVVARHTNLAAARTPSRLELTYIQCADALMRMLTEGAFPVQAAATGMRRGAPRVGDGLVRLDDEGVVVYASPNAVSDYRRLGYAGDLVGRSLAEVTSELVDSPDPVDESLPLVVTGRAAWRAEVEGRGGVALSMRAIPLTEGGPASAGGRRVGAVVLCRDVSELRRRERELLTKDATIREIHHRVKNNLQTVAALLRLQARRLPEGEARGALEEAMRRVATIAVVHETLSEGVEETVDFDAVVERAVLLASDGTEIGSRVRTVRSGQFGTVRAEDATPLALVLTELVTNAVEHGIGEGSGSVSVAADRDGQRLRMTVTDDGTGLPQGFAPGRTGLGTQIVVALVRGELRGQIEWRARSGGGTEVLLDVRLRDGGEPR